MNFFIGIGTQFFTQGNLSYKTYAKRCSVFWLRWYFVPVSLICISPGGRYDRSRSLKHNIAMSAPIMSRFDLFFVLVDECNEVTDYAIARRIIDLHSRIEESVDRIYEPEDISRYEKVYDISYVYIVTYELL